VPRLVDGEGLELVSRQIGVSGVGESETTFLSDELVQQFNAFRAIRRARADFTHGGWWYGILENTHADGSEEEISFINPYAAGVDALGTFPQTIPTDFDIWLHAVTVRAAGTTAGLLCQAFLGTGSQVALQSQAFGRDQANAPTGSVPMSMPLTPQLDAATNWTIASLAYVNSSLTGNPALPYPGMRLPRGYNLGFVSFTTTAAAVLQCQFLMGLYPIGMGSDVGPS